MKRRIIRLSKDSGFTQHHFGITKGSAGGNPSDGHTSRAPTALSKSGAGFTLVELMVSLGIFGIITGVVIANFRAGSRSNELRLAAESVAAVLREAETKAVAGAQSPTCAAGERALLFCPKGAVDCPGSICVAKVPTGGYGIEASPANPDRVILFADGNGDGRRQSGEETSETLLSSSDSVTVQTITPDGAASAVTFLPPAGKVLVNGAETDPEFSIILTHSATGARRKISVNRVSRLIEVTPL